MGKNDKELFSTKQQDINQYTLCRAAHINSKHNTYNANPVAFYYISVQVHKENTTGVHPFISTDFCGCGMTTVPRRTIIIFITILSPFSQK